ncbi:MAG: DDE-type integrase/transposase/recombinase [Flavobacteriales bacterium]|nr:DDE-type integrase/transposase/recombinase [Flavobacteriales bacterium]
MPSRNVYHTSLKELVHYDLMPVEYLDKIPRANISRWKNTFEVHRHIGSEINAIADNHTELIKTLNQFPRMFYAYGRLVQTLSDIISSTSDFNHIMRDAKKKVVDAIIRTSKVIPVQKAVKIFKISTSTFYTWVADVHLVCANSYFQLCNKIYSSQITPVEVQSIKAALTNKKTLHWSIRSIHLQGIRNGTLSISENTMYKVNKLLSIRKTKNRAKKKRYKKGIRAALPNRIWHADITTLKTLDNKRYYIYLVIDNYSRYILSYAIKERVSGLVTTSTIKEAYNKAMCLSYPLNIDLIVDGGPENNNIHISNFINQNDINIQKLVALRDINYSNSMIERVNMTLKYRYIFPKSPRDLKHLKRILRFFINDYNNIKPHGQLKGLTPQEAWMGNKPDDSIRTKALKRARIDRLEYNRANKCSKCS